MSVNAVPQTAMTAFRAVDSMSSSKVVEQEIKASQEAVRKAMDRLQELSSRSLTSLQISVNEATGTFIIRVNDAHNGSVVREIPSEHVLNGIAQLIHNEGLITDQKA